MIPIVDFSVPASLGVGELTCSVNLGCEVRLPPGDRVEKVTIGDDRWVVTVVSDGTDGPPQLVIYPFRERGAKATKLDVLVRSQGVDPHRSYAVVLTPAQEDLSRRLSFFAPRIDVERVAPPTPLPETALLDPAKTHYTWRYSGDPAIGCVTAFEYRGEVWCLLPSALLRPPSVHAILGRSRDPVDSRIVDDRYLVIESLVGPFDLQLSLAGVDHHGRLEYTGNE
ncbi:MAG: hypothetical protein WAJ85_03525 [Candidatus Baltobacteraceae bacterium]